MTGEQRRGKLKIRLEKDRAKRTKKLQEEEKKVVSNRRQQ